MRHITAKSDRRGFTLLELLVVLLIIGVIINFAVLSVGPGAATQAQEEIRRLAALIELAGQEAVMTSRELAVRVSNSGYDFLALDFETNELAAVEKNGLLRARTLPDGLRLQVRLEGEPVELGELPETGDDNVGEDENIAYIYLLSSGEFAQPFELMLRSLDADGDIYRLTGAANGKLELIYPDER